MSTVEFNQNFKRTAIHVFYKNNYAGTFTKKTLLGLLDAEMLPQCANLSAKGVIVWNDWQEAYEMDKIWGIKGWLTLARFVKGGELTEFYPPIIQNPDFYLVFNGRFIYFGENGYVTLYGGRDLPVSYRQYTEFISTNIDGEELCTGIRKLLVEHTWYHANKTVCDVATSLTAVMFASETARNYRAWPMGLMLLDLIQSGGKYGHSLSKTYSWANALWYPQTWDTVKPAKTGPSDGRNLDRAVLRDRTSASSRDFERKVSFMWYAPRPLLASLSSVSPKLGKGQYHQIAGKAPYSPTGGSYGQIRLDTMVNYIELKEAALLVNWLCNIVQFSLDIKLVIGYEQDNAIVRNRMTAKNYSGEETSTFLPSAMRTLTRGESPVMDTLTNIFKEVIHDRCTKIDFIQPKNFNGELPGIEYARLNKEAGFDLLPLDIAKDLFY